MTYTIDLKPELEPRLAEEAARHQQDATAFLRQIVEERLATTPEQPFYETATAEEWSRELRRMVVHSDAPYIPQEALRRENMYEERI